MLTQYEHVAGEMQGAREPQARVRNAVRTLALGAGGPLWQEVRGPGGPGPFMAGCHCQNPCRWASPGGGVRDRVPPVGQGQAGAGEDVRAPA